MSCAITSSDIAAGAPGAARRRWRPAALAALGGLASTRDRVRACASAPCRTVLQASATASGCCPQSGSPRHGPYPTSESARPPRLLVANAYYCAAGVPRPRALLPLADGSGHASRRGGVGRLPRLAGQAVVRGVAAIEPYSFDVPARAPRGAVRPGGTRAFHAAGRRCGARRTLRPRVPPWGALVILTDGCGSADIGGLCRHVGRSWCWTRAVHRRRSSAGLRSARAGAAPRTWFVRKRSRVEGSAGRRLGTSWRGCTGA